MDKQERERIAESRADIFRYIRGRRRAGDEGRIVFLSDAEFLVAEIKRLEKERDEAREHLGDVDRIFDQADVPTENEGIGGRVSVWRRAEFVRDLLWRYRKQLAKQQAAPSSPGRERE